MAAVVVVVLLVVFPSSLTPVGWHDQGNPDVHDVLSHSSVVLVVLVLCW
jgi:hypothetical protein